MFFSPWYFVPSRTFIVTKFLAYRLFKCYQFVKYVTVL